MLNNANVLTSYLSGFTSSILSLLKNLRGRSEVHRKTYLKQSHAKLLLFFKPSLDQTDLVCKNDETTLLNKNLKIFFPEMNFLKIKSV